MGKAVTTGTDIQIHGIAGTVGHRPLALAIDRVSASTALQMVVRNRKSQWRITWLAEWLAGEASLFLALQADQAGENCNSQGCVLSSAGEVTS